ncbi:hypothetical protein PV387_05120, partial [Streptomyces sp. ME02-6987-2C]|uniref:hypothetical protein n=1 Tax=Streptomyces sp. ME02-6987-2C TaxID=3028676 RepID=UPI0029A074FF
AVRPAPRHRWKEQPMTAPLTADAHEYGPGGAGTPAGNGADTAEPARTRAVPDAGAVRGPGVGHRRGRSS